MYGGLWGIQMEVPNEPNQQPTDKHTKTNQQQVKKNSDHSEPDEIRILT